MTAALARQIMAVHTAITMRGLLSASDQTRRLGPLLAAAENAPDTLAGVRSVLRNYYAPRQYGWDWGANTDRPQIYSYSKQSKVRVALHWHDTPRGVRARGYVSHPGNTAWGIAVAALVGDRRALHTITSERVAEQLQDTLELLADSDTWGGRATADAAALLRQVAATADMGARPKRLMRITHQGRTWDEEVAGTSPSQALAAAQAAHPEAQVMDLGPTDPDRLALLMAAPEGGLLPILKYLVAHQVADNAAEARVIQTRRRLGM